MIFGNKRGEVAMAVVIAVSLAAFLIGAAWRPLTSFLGIGGKDQKTVQKSTTVTESKPYYIKGEDNKMHLLEATKTTVSNLDTNEEVKLTIFQKLMNIGRIWVVLTVLGFFFAPLGAVMAVINRKAKAVAVAAYDKLQEKHDDMKDEAKTIVQSVDAGLNVFDSDIAAANNALLVTTDPQVKSNYQAIVLALGNSKTHFLAAMSKKQDSTTKVLVSELKNA